MTAVLIKKMGFLVVGRVSVPFRCLSSRRNKLLHQQIEAAARAGDMGKVRQLLAEEDQLSVVSSQPLRHGRSWTRQFLLFAAGYCGWNTIAAAHAYRVTHQAASLQQRKVGGTAEATLRLQSWALTAELATSSRGSDSPTMGEEAVGEDPVCDAPSLSIAERRILVFPRIYLTDVLGRSEWTLTCRKEAGSTSWSTQSG
eukprot:CAMPEP_0119314518 /NCGR_PEP_ID=MMETSP1333-20130426/33034_1 /TAXON_ID=418940 /ORGANISM="Scyphosphaera apsteinii, Strain RCC1455" /LENGTH=198 /DNA_ID=CAMNT_0007319641 /DNA_START=3 /DNA_END=595 /DNA_ORIENTATION=+